MQEIYLVSLIVGGGLLGFSLLSGGDGHSHFDSDTHSDFDSHQSLELHSDSSIEHVDHLHDIQHTNSADTVKFISIRNAIYFLAFFGLTGTVFDALSFDTIFTLPSAIGMGAFASYFGYKLMKYLKFSETGEATNLKLLEGKSAVITLPIHGSGKGKIQIDCKGQTEEMPAKIADASGRTNFNIRDKVLIQEVKDNVAYVIECEL